MLEDALRQLCWNRTRETDRGRGGYGGRERVCRNMERVVDDTERERGREREREREGGLR